MTPPLNVHGTGLVLGGVGLLIRGPSGAGKSLLALELLDRQELRREAGALLSDDRVDLVRVGDSLVMQAPVRIAGLIELRGRGIVSRSYVASTRLDLVVDLVDDLLRMLEEVDLVTDIMGVAVTRCPVPRRGIVDSAHQLLLIGEALRGAIGGTRHQKTT